VSLSAVPNKVFHGVLREVAPAADPVTRTFSARISVPDADASVRFGMSATVKVSGASNMVLLIPLSALYRNGAKTAVWTVDTATSTVRLVNVNVAAVREDGVVIDGGLHGGEMVVTAGVQKLQSGQRVRVIAQ
jgi:membrane fusion protein, multidrug efflux system